jgi:protein TonB
MDRAGRVLASRIERSSGRALLDREALAMLARAEVGPAPPPEISGATIELTIPVEFFLSR